MISLFLCCIVVFFVVICFVVIIVCFLMLCSEGMGEYIDDMVIII